MENRETGETSRESKGKAPLLGNSRGGSYKRAIGIFDVILRISAATAALAATITMGTTERTLPFFTQFFQFQASYDDLPAFTFFVIAMSIVSESNLGKLADRWYAGQSMMLVCWQGYVLKRRHTNSIRNLFLVFKRELDASFGISNYPIFKHINS